MDDNQKKSDEITELARERTLLASERTFLAWLRTGLAGVGGGVAIIRLLSFAEPLHQFIASIVGQVLMVWGIAIFLFAFIDFRQGYKRYKITNRSKHNLMIASLVTTLVILSLFLLAIT